MYPNDIIAGIDLYTILLGIAIISAILVFRICADRFKFKARFQNFCLFAALAAIGVGYFSAVLFQAFYDIEKNGGFKINSDTGATFYGGLIGGALSFILIYFFVGRIWFKNFSVHKKNFFLISNIAAASISIAHAFGRIGCLMAGCCHGKVTDAWYGIYMSAVGERVVPTQLFEAIFLFSLFALFIYRVFNRKNYNLSIYMGGYGIWRFVLEYFRDDYRGTTVVDFLTPSQFVALLMIIASVGFAILENKIMKGAVSKNDDGVE